MALHDKMATDLCATGAGELRCDKCDAIHILTPDEVAHHLRRGWPECHGLTMTWVTASQLAAENY